MVDGWKQRLYAGYVDSGQAPAYPEPSDLSVSKYPAFTSIIEKFVPQDRNQRIVDLGCGQGTLIYCLKQAGYANVAGADLSEQQVEIAKQLGIPEVILSDIDTFLSAQESPIDVVMAIDILEHLTPQELFETLDGIYRSLAVGGRIVLRVPNGAGIFGMQIRYGDFTHENCYTERSIHQILRTVGFKSVDSYESGPVRHNFKSSIRWIGWSLLTLQRRLTAACESGSFRCLLTRNLISVGVK